jgi:two-component system, NtrC family, C4-dicarboxylate transport response regulator DctD
MMPDSIKVLLVEDDPAVRIGSEQALKLAGFPVESFESAERVVPHIKLGIPAIVVSDVRLPGMDGLGLLRHVVDMERGLPVILVTGHGDVTMAVNAMREGAYDFIEKPFPSEHLVEVVGRAAEKRRLTLEVETLRNRLRNWVGIEATLLGRSPQMEQVRHTILDLADTSANVVVIGETGTGKELVARCLHEQSSRRDARFVAINCGGVPEQLFESEMFGHEPGAFTSANKRRIGKLEWANQGTLFLDEIESLAMSLQAKLLRVLQERKVERLGSNELIPIDCRVIAASQEDLGELVKQQRFRSDLYYRLNVAVIELSPLRERREDIPTLFEHFLLDAARRYEREAPIVSGPQLSELMAYSWPGNVRELHNVADRFVLGLLGEQFKLLKALHSPARTLADQVAQFERALIEEILRRHRGNASAASEALGLPKKTFYDKLHRFNLVAENFR